MEINEIIEKQNIELLSSYLEEHSFKVGPQRAIMKKIAASSWNVDEFKDYSSTSTKAFGLTGIVSNSSSDTISYTSTVYYYDLNHNLIAKGYNSNMAISGNNNFNLMSNLSILKEYTVNDIYYYSLLIEINDSSESNDSLILLPFVNLRASSVISKW